MPADARDAAYIDRAIPLGDGRMLAAPLVHGRMLAEAAPRADDKALLVGDGNGYLAALLRPLVGALDAVAPGDAAGLRKKAAYSLIVIDGAAEAAAGCHRCQPCRWRPAGDRRWSSAASPGSPSGARPAMLSRCCRSPKSAFRVLPELAAPKRWSF